jgi:signal transduction histidine kinase
MLTAVKYILTAISACLLSLHSLGQVVDLEELNRDPGYVFFNGRAEKLVNSTIITLDSVLKPASQDRFESLPNKTVIFHGLDPSFFWYRFSIRNADSVAKRAILLFGGKGVRSAELWQESGGNWLSYGKTGYKYPFASRPYVFPSHCYVLSVPPLTTTAYYIDVDESHAYKTINLALFEPVTMDNIKSRFYYFFGILTGLMVLFAVFNFYLYVAVKEPIHIWYGLYILFTTCFLIKHEGLDMQFLGLDSELGYRATSMAGFVGIGSGFLVHVVQLFLPNIARRSFLGWALFLDKWSLWISSVIYSIVFLVEPSHTIEVIVFEWSNKSAIIGVIIILAATVFSIAKGYKPAWILLLGQSAYLIGAMMRGLFVVGFSQVIPPAPFQIGLLIEVLIISFALMHRYNLFKKEKEQLSAQLKDQQLTFNNQILVTQENERKRIAEDLHDELGGNLAAIKMAVQSFGLPASQNELVKELIDKTSVTAREISHNLMPPDFEKTDLAEMLENHYSRLTAEGNTNFNFISSEPLFTFSKHQELMIYRILMELTTNINKHAMATEATVQLIYYNNYLELIVEDNGRGFNDRPSDGIGLKNVKSRVDYLGGSMNIDTGRMGSTIIITIPYNKDQ